MIQKIKQFTYGVFITYDGDLYSIIDIIGNYDDPDYFISNKKDISFSKHDGIFVPNSEELERVVNQWLTVFTTNELGDTSARHMSKHTLLQKGNLLDYVWITNLGNKLTIADQVKFILNN